MRRLLVAGRTHLSRRQPKPQVASLPRRFAALLIDALVGILALAGIIGMGVGAVALTGKRRVNSRFFRGLRSDGPNIATRLQSRRVQFILHGVAFAGSVLRKKRRSPGFRMLGLRRVDARTAGDVSRRQEIIRAGTRQAWRILCRRLLPPPKAARASPELEKLTSGLRDAHRRYANDQDALQLEIERIYQENKVAPMRSSCLPVFAQALLGAVPDLPMFWSALKQSLLDRLTGSVIVHDQPSQRRR